MALPPRPRNGVEARYDRETDRPRRNVSESTSRPRRERSPSTEEGMARRQRAGFTCKYRLLRAASTGPRLFAVRVQNK